MTDAKNQSALSSPDKSYNIDESVRFKQVPNLMNGKSTLVENRVGTISRPKSKYVGEMVSRYDSPSRNRNRSPPAYQGYDEQIYDDPLYRRAITPVPRANFSPRNRYRSKYVMMNNLTNVRADPTAVRSRSQLSNIDIPINRNSYLDELRLKTQTAISTLREGLPLNNDYERTTGYAQQSPTSRVMTPNRYVPRATGEFINTDFDPYTKNTEYDPIVPSSKAYKGRVYSPRSQFSPQNIKGDKYEQTRELPYPNGFRHSQISNEVFDKYQPRSDAAININPLRYQQKYSGYQRPAEDFMRRTPVNQVQSKYQNTQQNDIRKYNIGEFQATQPRQNNQNYNGFANNKTNNNNNANFINNNSEAIFTVENFPSGAKYEGQIINGKKNGQGRFTYADGGVYDGQWVENKISGRGTLYYASGQKAYEGEWLNDQFQGWGTLYNQDPVQSRQPYDYRSLVNVSDVFVKYEGEFTNDLKHGQGTLYLSNLEVFKGQFENDQINGNGQYQKLDGKTITGVWRNNKLVQS